MVYNNNRYADLDAATIAMLNEAHIVGGTKEWVRWNKTGTRGIVEVEPGSVYYNSLVAKTHQQILEVVVLPEYNADE
jgi:hypothetical protein